MRSLTAALPLIGICCLGCPARANLDVSAKLPADTRLLVRARLSDIVRTPLGRSINISHDVKLNEIRQFVRQHIGLNLDRVECIWLVSCKPDTAVIILKGDLAAGRIAAIFSQNPDVAEVSREGCPFVARFKNNDSGKMQLGAVIDEQTVAFGDVPSMDHYLDTVTGRSNALPVDHPQLRAFAAESGLVSATVLGNLAHWGDFDPDLAAVIQGVRLDAKVENDALLRLTLDATDERQAEGFELTLRGLLILKGESEGLKANAFLYRLAQRATVNRQGATVTVDSMLPRGFLESVVDKKLE